MNADLNLLFGLLALQNEFIDKQQLVAAFGAWMADHSKALDEILVQQRALKEVDRALLSRLVDRHVAARGGDVTASLRAISSVGSICDELEHLADRDMTISLAKLRPMDQDTIVPSIGQPTASGQRFEIRRPLARGGLGVVSIALDKELNREIALKEIRTDRADDEAYRSKFVLEAEVTGGLEHPGIVPVYGLGTGPDGRPYYAMRLIKGDNLQEHVKWFHANVAACKEPFDGTELRKLLRRLLDVCQAIDYAHSRGILHRDLKPGNIMLGKYGETLVVDWGLAKPLGTQHREQLTPTTESTIESPLVPSGSNDGMTIQGSMVGTAAYAPPEQLSGDLDQVSERSDVYGLGAMLYELLTGQPPAQGNTLGAVIKMVVEGAIKPPRSIQPQAPKPLEAICMRAIAKRPEDRFSTAAELGQEIERWLDDLPVKTYPEPMLLRSRRWIRSHQAIVATASAIIFMSTIGLGLYSSIISKTNAKLDQKNLELTTANERETDARRNAEEQSRLAVEAKERESIEREKAVELANNIQRQQRRQAVKKAGECFNSNDLSAAHFWLTNAVPDESSPDKQERELALSRLDVLWNYLPRFTQFWKLPSDLAFCDLSHDESRLIAVDMNHNTTIYDTTSGKLVAGPLHQDTPIFSAALNREGSVLITVGGSMGVNGEMKVWDTSTNEEIVTPVVQPLFTFLGAKFLKSDDCFLTFELNLEGKYVIKTWRIDRENRALTETSSIAHSNRFIKIADAINSEHGYVLVYKIEKGPNIGEYISVVNAETGESVSKLEIAACDDDSSSVQLESAGFISGSSTIRLFLRRTNGLLVTRVWDPVQHKLLGEPMILPEGRPIQVGMVSDLNWIVIRKNNGLLSVFDQGSSKLPWLLDAPKGNMEEVVFSDNGRFVAIPLADGQVQVWDILADRAVTTVLRHGESISYMRFAKHGRQLIVGTNNGTIRTWDFATTDTVSMTLFQNALQNVKLLDDNSFLVQSSDANGPWFQLFHKNSDGIDVSHRITPEIRNAKGVVVSANGHFAIVTSNGQIELGSVFNADKKALNLKRSVGNAHQLAFTKSGKMLGYLVSKYKDGPAAIASDLYTLDTTSGKSLPTAIQWDKPNVLSSFLPTQISGTTCFAFDREGERILVGGVRASLQGLNGEVKLIDTKTGKAIGKSLSQPSGTVPFHVVFHPTQNNALILSGGVFSSWFEISIWNLDSFEKQPAEFRVQADSIAGIEGLNTPIGFSPNGRLLAVPVKDRLEILDSVTLKRKMNALSHSSNIAQCVFHPKLPLIATRCADQTIRVWDTENATLFMPIIENNKTINGIAFNADKLAGAGSDGNLRLWDLKPDALLYDQHQQAACAFAGLKFDTLSGEASADATQIEEDWKSLVAAYPDKFQSRKDQIRSWNSLVIDEFEKLSMWNAAVPYIEELVALFPENPYFFEQIADYESELGNFKSGADWYKRTAELCDKQNSNTHLPHCKAVTACLAYGDHEAYAKECKALVDRWKDTKNPQIARYVAKLCFLSDESPVDLGILVQMAQRSLDIETKAANKNGQLYSQLVRGMCLLRQKKYLEAFNALTPVVEARDLPNRSVVMQAHAHLAMSLYKLDRKSDGLKHLQTAIDLDRDYTKSKHYRGAWEQYFHFSTALKEATAIFERINIDETRDVALLATRAEGLGRLKDWAQADAIWEQIFEVAPEDVSIRQRWDASLTAGERWNKIAAYYSATLDGLPTGWKNNLPRSKLIQQILQRRDGVFEALRAFRPQDSLMPLSLARDFVLRNDLEKAVDAYSHVVPETNEPEEKYEHAAALLLAGKVEAYRDFLTRCVKASEPEPADDANLAYALARMAVLTTEELVPWTKVVEWGEKAAKEDKAWYCHVAGLAHLRAGKLDEAFAWLEKTPNPKWHPELNQVALCLVHAHRGDQTKAREYLAAARAWLEKMEVDKKDGYYQVQETDWLEFQILLTEAEAVVKKF